MREVFVYWGKSKLMFANEESMLNYFSEHYNINIDELENFFDNSTREEILKVATDLEKKNQIIYSDSALWTITNIGLKENLKNTESSYDRRNFNVAIIFGVLSTLIALVSLFVSLRR